MQVSSVHSIPMKGSVVNNTAAANPQEKKDVKEIIKDNWPVLLFFGINEDRNLYDQTNHLTETKYKNIIIHSNRKIEVTMTKSSVSLLPKENQILLNDNYNFIQ